MVVQKDLIKSPLLYIIICITFLYSCPKIASYDVEVGNIKGNTQKEVLLRTTLPLQLRLQFTFVHMYIQRKKRMCQDSISQLPRNWFYRYNKINLQIKLISLIFISSV